MQRSQTACAYRPSAQARSAIISSSVAMSNSRIELACSSLSRTDWRGLNNLRRMSAKAELSGAKPRSNYVKLSTCKAMPESALDLSEVTAIEGGGLGMLVSHFVYVFNMDIQHILLQPWLVVVTARPSCLVRRVSADLPEGRSVISRQE